MFERTLQDLIRGLRAHKASSKAQEDAFLAEAMEEIRIELKGKDMALKAEGIIKTCYVSILHEVTAASNVNSKGQSLVYELKLICSYSCCTLSHRQRALHSMLLKS